MTTGDQINKLLMTAHDLMMRANSDPELAERLLSAAHDTIAQEAGFPVPDGIEISAVRDETGTLQMEASLDPELEDEIDDAVLEQISGGDVVGDGPEAPGEL